MTSDIAWEWYRSFLEVTRCGSLSAAARALGMTQPTVGRHIAALEQQLGQALFVRTATGLQVTEQGRALQPYAASMEHTVAALERTARRHTREVVGTVRISASEVLATQVLPELLAPLVLRHPGLQLEIVASDQVDDLLHRAADVAVRMLRPTQTQLIAQHLGRVELGLFAHPRYLHARGLPQSLDDLLNGQHTLIGFDKVTPFVRTCMQQWPALERAHFGLRTDNASTSLALLRAGAGVGLCQVALAEQAPALQRVLPAQMALHLDMWLAMHEDLRSQRCCQVVFQALSQGLKGYAAHGNVAHGTVAQGHLAPD